MLRSLDHALAIDQRELPAPRSSFCCGQCQACMA